MADDTVWLNCRLQLAGGDDDDDSGGVVARLYSTAASRLPPAARQSLQALAPCSVSLGALAVQHLVNRRGPDGLVGAIPGGGAHAARLLALAARCHAAGEVLAGRGAGAGAPDVVLVPREPAAAAADAVAFVVYATNLAAVALCERLRLECRAALVLDLDATLVDATPLDRAFAESPDCAALPWTETEVENSGGRRLPARWAPLPPEAVGSPPADGVYAIAWEPGAGRPAAAFALRVRPGWWALRAHLRARAARFAPFVCSKGKLEYVQLIWAVLDPEGGGGDEAGGARGGPPAPPLIPRAEWRRRLSSTFPDGLPAAAQKTALVALGCAATPAEPARSHGGGAGAPPPPPPPPPTLLAAPVLCVDDSPDAYDEAYEACLLYVTEYRPSDLPFEEPRAGAGLAAVGAAADEFWAATCGAGGTHAWAAAQAYATAILGAARRARMESPEALAYLQARCAVQGAALAAQFTPAAVLGGGGGPAPAPRASPPRPAPALRATLSLPADLGGGGGGRAALAHVLSVASSSPGSSGDLAAEAEAAAAEAEARADEAVHAALMMQC